MNYKFTEDDFLNEKENIKEYWERMHNDEMMCLLSNNSGNVIWKNLNIIDLIKKDKVILNIGVGTGRCTKELIDLGAIVDVLDISESAINNVRNIVRNSYIVKNLESIKDNEYDLVISNLVSQHMNDEDLIIQMKKIIKSLKEDGIFAVQQAGILDLINNTQDLVNQKGGRVCRTLSKFSELIESCGGIIMSMKIYEIYSHYNSYGYYLHVMKKINKEKK